MNSKIYTYKYALYIIFFLFRILRYRYHTKNCITKKNIVKIRFTISMAKYGQKK